MKRVPLTCVLLILTAAPAFAQARKCEPADTIDICLSRAENAIAAAVAQKKVAGNTGAPALTSPLGTALKDFVTLFTASADSSILTRGDDGSLTLDLNAGSNKFVTGRPLKIQAVLHEPQLDPKVKAGLSGDTLVNTEKSLDELDDISLSLSYSPQNRAIGRTLSPHRDLFETLIGHPGRTPQFLILLALLHEIQKDFPEVTSTAGLPPVGQLGERREKIEAAIFATAAEQLAQQEVDKALLKSSRVKAFLAMLEQQPQAYASVVQRSRNELIGGDSLSFKVTYETSGRGLRSFYKFAPENGCSKSQLKEGAPACEKAWDNFLAQEKTTAALSNSGRLSFSIEYAGVDANKVEVPLPAPATAPFKLETDDTESLIGSVTYGWMISKAAEGPRESRFDLKASYENVTGDKDKDNRFIASAVFTQKLTEKSSFPIGIVYANHEKDPAFKDTNRKLSVHFGLVFKMPSLSDLSP